MQFMTTQSIRTLPDIRREAPHYLLLQGGVRVLALMSYGLAIGVAHGFDSGLSFDYLYRNRPGGRTVLGRSLDRAYLNHESSRAARARKSLLLQTMWNHVLVRRNEGLPISILDVASGPGRYHLELLKMMGGTDIHITCRDIDEQSLTRGRHLAAHLGLSRHMRYEHGDTTSADGLHSLGTPPDLVVVSGFYETLTDDAAVCRSLMELRAVLPTGGTLLLTTQVWHPWHELAANVLPDRHGKPWITCVRPLSRMERWVREAGFHHRQSHVEPHGWHAVIECSG
jgi:SAM-dependent methyltransferase